MVCFESVTETQGLFMQEAWEMGVPTIHFDPGYYKNIYTDKDKSSSVDMTTCPYLSEKAGLSFADLKEFEEIIQRWSILKNQFSPKEYCEKFFSDEKSAQLFLENVKLVYAQ